MADETNEGVSYLRALKQSPPGTGAASGVAPARESKTEATPASGTAGPGSEGKQFPGTEKRRSARYKCVGSAEMCQEASDVHTWATFTDISMHGCYVEATATYPVGTLLEMKLEAKAHRVRTKGTVRVSYPNLGMGIAFTEIAEDHRARLKELLRTISRPSVIIGPGIASAASSPAAFGTAPPISDPTAAVRTLVEFFASRHVLMRDEFLRLLRKSQGLDTNPGQQQKM
jgi:hypothetical protein